MTALPATSMDKPERLRRLRALGVLPCRLRNPVVAGETTVVVATSVQQDCVVVAPDVARNDPRQRAQVLALLAAARIGEDTLDWLDPVALDHGEPPQARAYVALGHAAARALGQALPTALRESAVVVVTETEPAEWLARPVERRAVWRALLPLRRRAPKH